MRRISILLIILIVLLQTGCWNAREINELAFVLSIGLDKAGDGFKVTAQIAKPATYSKTPSGGGTDTEKPYWVISATGKTIFEAIRNMASVSSRRIFWSHIKLIILSEELAKSSTLEIFDFFSRNPELRLRTLVAVTPGEAGKLFDIIPKMEKDPSLYLEKIIENKSLTGKSYGIMLKDFLEEYLDQSVGPVTSRIIVSSMNSELVLKTSGAYVFGNNKLIGSLNEQETRGLLWLKNKMGNSVIVVNCPFDGLPITLEIKNSDIKYESYLVDNMPYFTIKVDAAASVIEQGCRTDYNDTDKLDELKKTVASSIETDIQSAVARAKELGVDFSGFSRVLHRQHKKEWHQISEDWHDIFKDAEVNATAIVDIPHVSLAKPLKPIKTPDENTD